MSKKNIFIVTLILLALFWVIFKGSAAQKRLAGAGREKVYPHRIISLCSAATEILYYLKADSLIVAVDDGSKLYTPFSVDKPAVGNAYASLNIELITLYQPDLVLCSPSKAEILKARGFQTLAVKTCNVDETLELIDQIGETIGRKENARKITDWMRTEIVGIQEKVKQVSQKPLVYFEAHREGLSRGRGTLTDDLITLAGGINLAHSERARFPVLSREVIMERDPDVIIVESYDLDGKQIMDRPGWRQIKAIRNDRIYTSTVNFTNYTPRLVEGLRTFASWLHPELFRTPKSSGREKEVSFAH